MRWRVAALLIGVGISSGTLATKGRAEPPDSPEVSGPVIEAPSVAGDTPPASPPAVPAEVKPSPEPATNVRPLLILPGMAAARGSNKPRPTAPRPTPRVILSTPVANDPPGSDVSEALPRDAVDGLPGELPMTLESIPTDEAKPSEKAKKPKEPSGKPSVTRANPNASARPSPLQRRPSTALGRLFTPLGRGRWDDDVDSIRVDPKSDPAAEAAMKRRIEKQIRESLGSRLKAFDVRVVGRDVVIRAQAARFWQKRSDRTTIEALPALSGYNVLVEVVD